MLSDEGMQRLKEKFGTNIPGKCKNCKLKTKNIVNQYINAKLECNSDQCKLLGYMALMEIEEDAHSNRDTAPESVRVANKLSKLNFLGYDTTIEHPWAILVSDNSKVWINYKNKLMSKKSYVDIINSKYMLLCRRKDNILELFSADCGDKNLLEGLECTESINLASGRSIYGRVYVKNLWAFRITEPVSRKKFILLVSRYGKRLLIKSDDTIILDESNDAIRVLFRDHLTGIKLSNTFDILSDTDSMILSEI